MRQPQRVHAGEVWLLLVAIAASSQVPTTLAGESGAELLHGPSTPTYDWSPRVEGEGESSQGSVAAVAGRFLGDRGVTVHSAFVSNGDFLDRCGLLEARESREAVKADFTIGLEALRQSGLRPEELQLSIVLDAKTSDFLAAFTAPKEQWVVSQDGARDAANILDGAGWKVSAPKDFAPKSTVSEVISQLVSAYGINPNTVGQIVVRPSEVKRAVRDGTVQPLNGPGPDWLIEIHGYPHWFRHGTYKSGAIVAMGCEDLRQSLLVGID